MKKNRTIRGSVEYVESRLMMQVSGGSWTKTTAGSQIKAPTRVAHIRASLTRSVKRTASHALIQNETKSPKRETITQKMSFVVFI